LNFDDYEHSFDLGNLEDMFFGPPERKQPQEQQRTRIKKLNINDYTSPVGQQNLIKDFIEKINELILKVELVETMCITQTKIMTRLEQEIKNIEKNMLL
jgi:hypothetical protein